MLCLSVPGLFVAVKRQEFMLQTKDLVLIFDVTMLCWSSTDLFSKGRWGHARDSTGDMPVLHGTRAALPGECCLL